MKKVLLLGSISIALFIFSCNNATENTDGNAHTHEDGTVHSDHAPDTVKPAQQEFDVADTTHTEPKEEHSHEDGHTHTH